MTEKTELAFKEYLSSQKLKYTPERRKIFAEVLDTKGVFDAEKLLARLSKPQHHVSRATVYRTLDLLLKLGIVRRVTFGQNTSLFENNITWKPSGNFICIGCGKITEFKIAKKIDDALEKTCKAHNFRAQNRSIDISGYCKECEKNGLSKFMDFTAW